MTSPVSTLPPTRTLWIFTCLFHYSLRCRRGTKPYLCTRLEWRSPKVWQKVPYLENIVDPDSLVLSVIIERKVNHHTDVSVALTECRFRGHWNGNGFRLSTREHQGSHIYHCRRISLPYEGTELAQTLEKLFLASLKSRGDLHAINVAHYYSDG